MEMKKLDPKYDRQIIMSYLANHKK